MVANQTNHDIELLLVRVVAGLLISSAAITSLVIILPIINPAATTDVGLVAAFFSLVGGIAAGYLTYRIRMAKYGDNDPDDPDGKAGA